MKPIQLLTRKMWRVFGVQVFFSILITASLLVPGFVMLSSVESSNQETIELSIKGRQYIARENDPEKLRAEANLVWDQAISEGQFRERALRFAIKMCAMMGFGLLIFSCTAGICAYKLQSLVHAD